VQVDRQQIDIIDLNIGENYLNDWDVYYAIREIIANALDEQQNENIEITYKNEEDECIIRDFGSGLKIENFIMMGSSKISNGNVIGKFGVGLKDALGVLNNNGIQVKIRTAKNLFEFYMKEKSKITNAQTLHVYVYPNNDKAFKGTEFIFKKNILSKLKKNF